MTRRTKIAKGGARTYFIGADHHKQVSVMTVPDEDGQERKDGRVPNLRRYV